MARVHSELYRPFEGRLSSFPLRFWPIAASGIRAGLRRKLPLLLLYLPPFIATMVFSFLVYARYSALQAVPDDAGFRERALASLATRMLEVRELILQFNIQVRYFALLATAWYGAGLLADDRRLGAHQLYFSRPLTRLGYSAGKLSVAAFFGSLAVLAPILVIALVATFSSPDWAFLKDDWRLVLRSVLYSLLWVLCVASLVLACSSLAGRKAFALAGVFAFVMLTSAAGGALSGIYRDPRFAALGLPGSFQIVGESLLGARGARLVEDPTLAWISIAATTLLSLAVIARGVRRLEVVA